MVSFKYQEKIIYVEDSVTKKRKDIFSNFEEDDFKIFKTSTPLLKRKLIINDTTSNKIHYVCNIHFQAYLEKRKCLPYMCLLFSKLKERQVYLESKGVLI